MRIAVLSDIHANLQALQAVVRDCETQQIDEFWLLGDYVDYGADNTAVLSLLAALPVSYAVAGNHDACLFLPEVPASQTPHGYASYLHTKKIAESNPGLFQWLRGIAATPQIKLSEPGIMLVHGTPDNPYWGKFTPESSARTLFTAMEQDNIDVMFMGHSHIRFLLTQGGRMIINPGSVGQPRNGCPYAQYAIWEDGTVMFRQIPYAVDEAAAAIRAAGLPEYLWKRLYQGR